MKTLNELIDHIASSYQISSKVINGAKDLDARCLNAIGTIVGSRSARISPKHIHEVTKWGINNDLSVYDEVRALS